MQRLFLKRSLRELKAGFLKYFSLFLMITFSMFIIVSLIGAADTVIENTRMNDLNNNVESGQFTTFIPLSQKQEDEITATGTKLEKMFHLDYTTASEHKIRVFRIRKNLNLVMVYAGRLAQNSNEITLERRYCEENNIKPGDKYELGGHQFTVSGITVSGDYDGPFEELSSVAVDSRSFATAFVTDELYDQLKSENTSSKSEQYVYSYLLSENTTDDEIKELLENQKVDPEDIDDPFFKEYWDSLNSQRNEIIDGVNELVDGVDSLADGFNELQDGMSELTDNNYSIRQGSRSLLDGMVSYVGSVLKSYGLDVSLTSDNYGSVLNELSSAVPAEMAGTITSMKEILDNVAYFNRGINSYLNGANSVEEGMSEFNEGIDELKEGVSELKDTTDEILDKYFVTEVNNLTSFVKRSANQRIDGAANDLIINKYGAIVAGFIIIILFAYVISVFIIHTIERESATIGTLYALGVSRNQIISSYILLPSIVCLSGGIAGFALGLSKYGIAYQLYDAYNYFSLPELPIIYSPWLVSYCIVMPPLLAALVNYLVLNRKLKKEPLDLMRNRQNESNEKLITLGNMPYSVSFRLRQLLKEARSGFTVVFSMFVCLLLMFIGMNCYYMCDYLTKQAPLDTRFEYLYTLKYPQETVPEQGEAMYSEVLSKEGYGYTFEITLLGIDDDNQYFPVNVSDRKYELVISSAMSEKFNIKKGEEVILKSEADGMHYAFTVKDITENSSGFYGFMDIDAMRELFGKSEDYYNAIASSSELDIPSGRLYSTITRSQIIHSSEVFIKLMASMIYTMVGFSGLIFVIVMYLMFKVMIERSIYNISLFKIFGYRNGEIRSFFLSGNFITVVLGAAISIPAAKWVMDRMYPYMISNVACGMHLEFPRETYMVLFGAIIVFYLLSNLMLMVRINKITPAEVLKNAE